MEYIVVDNSDKNGKAIGIEELVKDFLCVLEGSVTRMKELHWSAETNAAHKLTDDMIDEIPDYIDNIAEDCMGVLGFKFHVGDIVPVVPEQETIRDLIIYLQNSSDDLRDCLCHREKCDGIINILDDFSHYLNKSKYLETFN